jgi:lipoprotein-anchoring transpeptidase ErfK/SrfK
MSVWPSRRPRIVVVAGVIVAGLVLAGCSGSGTDQPAGGPGGTGSTTQGQPPTSPTEEPVVPATLTSSVKSAATGVPVDTRVTVGAANGTLTSVVFTSEDGTALAGTFNADKSRWTASELLDPGTQYTIRSTGKNADGLVTRSTRTFTTEDLTLDQQTYPSVSPLQGQVMGIAMPVIVHFDIPVTNRAEFEKHMAVTSQPAQQGSWHWISGTEAHWRPKVYWQPGTKVSVDLSLNGVNAGHGIYGQMDRHVKFRIGDAVLIRVNVATDFMHVFQDGKLARIIPITGGKPGGFQTRSGIKVISEKYLVKRMNSATVGIDPNGPEGYNIPDVQFAMRVTNSGEFLHAAPWSVYAQGHYNVSHGCVGMSTENAQWLYNLAPIGTPVEVTGSTRPIEPQNGWTDWDMSFAEWESGSALS